MKPRLALAAIMAATGAAALFPLRRSKGAPISAKTKADFDALARAQAKRDKRNAKRKPK